MERREMLQQGPEEGAAGETGRQATGEQDGRAQLLSEQAQAILEMGGPNMLEAFRADPVIREKVLRGEWDFMIAYGYLLGRESARGGQARRGVPQAVRTPNNANTRRSIASMSAKEFDELDQMLAKGGSFELGR